jgi:leucyl-tRNA synthetase
MDEKYFPKKVEAKWQARWREARAFAADANDERPKFYQLEMLPYPSGNLHMGHVRNYSAGDALAWYKRLKGFNVLHPIGWDSFGQPAEDAAVKRGVNPREWTEENIAAMRGQLERLGIGYEWERQIAAHRPEYYKFDQWFFLKMFERGLAYKKMTQVNWCSHDQATLSNEQASGGICWRCGNPVTKKDLEQWFLKITAYADQLLDQLDEIEAGWPRHVVKRQRDWIGRSDGAFLDFRVSNAKCAFPRRETTPPAITENTVTVFTTRIDTVFGANAIVVAAEHPIIQQHLEDLDEEVVKKIVAIRVELAKPVDRETEIEKDGVDTGLTATNPFSGEEMPVWVGNYVMMEYGKGAVMSVPGHDERDFDFAKKFDLPIRTVIVPGESAESGESRGSEAFTDYGVLVDSGEWSGKPSETAIAEMTAFAEQSGFGERATTYRIRDWGVSRQRFWGSPIPIVYCDDCGTVPEKYENLPVELPETAPFTGTGESPLAKVPAFYETTCPKCGGAAKRETDTMDTFVDSSWYFFRYLDPANPDEPFDPAAARRWTPVDQYIGGDDHAVMHLIYTRFWTKVMRDLGLVDFDEPVKRLLTQGMVVGETFFTEEGGKRTYFAPPDVSAERDPKGRITAATAADGTPLKWAIERMSKSKGNGVDPDEMVEIYGADAARLFILFAAPIENELVWNESGIEGAVRFLQRAWRLVHKWEPTLAGEAALAAATHGGSAMAAENAPEFLSPNARLLRQKTHQTIKRVTDSFESLQFNTPVAALMELANSISDIGGEPADAGRDEVRAVHEALTSLVLMLTPFAPHAAEELYTVVSGKEGGILAAGAQFPEYSEELARADAVEIPVQVNGKLRARIMASPEASDEELRDMALSDPKVGEHTDGKEIVKVVVVPKRLVSVVVKG